MIFNIIGWVAMILSFLLPAYLVWFWFCWYRTYRNQGSLWRRIVGLIAALLASCAILWRFVYPAILHHHFSRVGSEDQTWWYLAILSIRIGVWLSAAAFVLGVISLGRTRVFSAASSVVMLATYLVQTAIL